jgi:hypothetical protein
MKPLVLWCRWHEAVLRLHGRDTTAVWGELAFADHDQPFHYHLPTRQLTLGTPPQQEIRFLDEVGVERVVE